MRPSFFYWGESNQGVEGLFDQREKNPTKSAPDGPSDLTGFGSSIISRDTSALGTGCPMRLQATWAPA